MSIWKQSPSSTPTIDAQPAPAAPVRPAAPVADVGIHGRRSVPPADHSVIGRGLSIRGEITGTDAVYLDGKLEGTIKVPGARVTIGPNGTVEMTPAGALLPCIEAREVLVIGTITGNLLAQERVEIHATGSLTGNIGTRRIRIEDGAHFRGGIDILQLPGDAAGPESAAPELFNVLPANPE